MKIILTKYIAIIAVLYLVMMCSGCISYKYSTKNFFYCDENNEKLSETERVFYENYKKKALCHPLYRIIPRHRSQIRWYDLPHWLTWGLFGNDDQGVFAEEQYPFYLQDKKVSLCKAFLWGIRNPLHNFCFYVIGSAGLQNDEFTIVKINRKKCAFFQYCNQAKTVFGGKYSSFYFGLHLYKPIISLRLCYNDKWRSDFYIGWRERGNFGIKFLPLTKNSLVMWDDLKYDD